MRGITLRDYEREFRSEINSEDLNRNFGEIYDDIAEALLRYQYVNNKLSEHISDMNYEIQSLTAKIEDLEGAYASLNSSLSVLYWDAHSDVEVLDSTCNHEKSVGNVTLEWSKNWTKMQVTVNEWGDNEAGPNVSVAVDDGGGEVYIDRPDDIYDALDNNPQTNWVVEYDDPVPSGLTVRIEVPPSMNPSINNLYVAPFPDGGPTIESVEYITVLGSWIELATNINSRTRLHFTPVDYGNQVRFTISPVELLNSEMETVGVFGVQDIDVGFIEYSSTGYIVIELEHGTTISAITSVTADYSITPSTDESVTNPFVLEIFEDSGLNTRCYSSTLDGHPFTGSISISTSTTSLYAKVTMKKINNTTPVLRSITVGIT
jgi:hypothetical protein